VMYVMVRVRSPRHIRAVATSRMVTRRARPSGAKARARMVSQGVRDGANVASTQGSPSEKARGKSRQKGAVNPGALRLCALYRSQGRVKYQTDCADVALGPGI